MSAQESIATVRSSDRMHLPAALPIYCLVYCALNGTLTIELCVELIFATFLHHGAIHIRVAAMVSKMHRAIVSTHGE